MVTILDTGVRDHLSHQGEGCCFLTAGSFSIGLPGKVARTVLTMPGGYSLIDKSPRDASVDKPLEGTCR